MDSRMKENQLFLMKRVDALTDELHYIMRILDLISQLVEQDEEDEMKQPKLMRSCNIDESSDSSDDEIRIAGSKSVIQLLEDDSDEE
jgi:hypothetical protein